MKSEEQDNGEKVDNFAPKGQKFVLVLDTLSLH